MTKQQEEKCEALAENYMPAQRRKQCFIDGFQAAQKLENAILIPEVKALTEALALFMSCKNMKGAHLKIGLQMANEAAKEAMAPFRG